MKKRNIFAVLLTLMMIALAACSGSNNVGESASSTVGSESSSNESQTVSQGESSEAVGNESSSSESETASQNESGTEAGSQSQESNGDSSTGGSKVHFCRLFPYLQGPEKYICCLHIGDLCL